MQRNDPRRTRKAKPIPLPPGPKPKDLDLEQVAMAAGIGCTVEEIAAIMKMAHAQGPDHSEDDRGRP